MPTPTYPNLRHIRLFVACAETGSLTSAATALGITQPAASQALRRLEKHLDTGLVERDTMTLTAEGRIALQSATTIPSSIPCDRAILFTAFTTLLPRSGAAVTKGWSFSSGCFLHIQSVIKC